MTVVIIASLLVVAWWRPGGADGVPNRFGQAQTGMRVLIRVVNTLVPEWARRLIP